MSLDPSYRLCFFCSLELILSHPASCLDPFCLHRAANEDKIKIIQKRIKRKIDRLFVNNHCDTHSLLYSLVKVGGVVLSNHSLTFSSVTCLSSILCLTSVSPLRLSHCLLPSTPSPPLPHSSNFIPFFPTLPCLFF